MSTSYPDTSVYRVTVDVETTEAETARRAISDALAGAGLVNPSHDWNNKTVRVDKIDVQQVAVS